MIILDTNELRANQSLDSPTLHLLRAVAETSGHRLALPALVIEEFVAHHRQSVTEAVSQAERAIQRVRELAPTATIQTPAFPRPEVVASEVGQRVRETFETLVLDAQDAVVALRRELARERPASTSWDKAGTGARDAAIWLTVLRASEREGDVYFVSRDRRAFGEGELHEELADEVAKRGTTVNYCGDLTELLDRLAERAEADDETISRLAASEHLRLRVAEELARPELLFEILEVIPSLARAGGASDTRTGFVLDTASHSAAYSVGSSLWVTSRLRWNVTKRFAIRDPVHGLTDDWLATFSLPTSVLVRMDARREVETAQVMSRGPIEIEHLYPERTYGTDLSPD